MNNPIPAAVRLWLYLLAAVVLTVAVGGVVPEQYFKLVMTSAAVLLVLSAANVTMPGTHGTLTVATVTAAPVEPDEADLDELDEFAAENPADPEVEGREGLA